MHSLTRSNCFIFHCSNASLFCGLTETRQADYLLLDPCNAKDLDPSTLPITMNNKIYSPGGEVIINCDGTMMTDEEYQSHGLDPNTVVRMP